MSWFSNLYGGQGRTVLVVAALVLASVGSARAAPCPETTDPSCSATAAYGNVSAQGDQGENIMRQPQALDLAGGSIYVGDRWGWHVQQFNATHGWVDQWGEYGTGPGQFTGIGGIAHDLNGNVYVLDIDNNRVEKFDAGHRLLATWGGKGVSGTGSAEFDINFKGGIAVDGSSFVYVSDTYNHRVVKFDTNGTYLGQLGVTGVPGADNAHFRYPQGLSVDASHDVFVADDQNDRIQKFDSSGPYLATIGSSATLNHPYDLGVDGTGSVYVADNLNHRVDKFSSNGSFVTSWGGKGTAPGQLQTPRAIAVDSAGNNFVADTNNGRVQEFDADGNLVTTSGTNPWGLNGRDDGRLSGPQGLDFANGRLLVADTLEYWIQELDATDGSPITKFGGHGTGPGQFELPGDVAADSAGTVDVTDTNNDRVERFDTSNSFIQEIDGFLRPAGIAVDATNNVYVADTGHDRVQEFNAAGSLLSTWTTFGAGDSFSHPDGVAVSSAGDLYVADTGNGRLVEFDANGSFVRAWPVSGAAPSRPSGIDVDSAGDVYVADPANGEVQKYDSAGHWLLAWGQRGHALGEFWTGAPNDVTVGAGGDVYVTDTYDNRVERFTFGTDGSSSAGPPETTPPSGSSSGATGTQAVASTASPVDGSFPSAPPPGADAGQSAGAKSVARARAMLSRALARDVPRRLRIDRRGRVFIRVTACPAPSALLRSTVITCSEAVGGSVSLSWRGTTLATAKLKPVRPGRSRVVALQLSKSARVRLAHGGRIAAVARIALTPRATLVVAATRRVVIAVATSQ